MVAGAQGWGFPERRKRMTAEQTRDVFEVRLPPIVSRACRDGCAALAYIRSRATELGIDPQRIGAWGGSAGGGIVKGMCFGIPENGSAYVPFDVAPEDRPCVGLLAMPSGNPALPEVVPADSPPLLLQHGLADVTVDVASSKEFAQQVRERAGSPVTEIYYPGEGHGFQGEAAALATAREIDFLAEHGIANERPPQPRL